MAFMGLKRVFSGHVTADISLKLPLVKFFLLSSMDFRKLAVSPNFFTSGLRAGTSRSGASGCVVLDHVRLNHSDGELSRIDCRVTMELHQD